MRAALLLAILAAPDDAERLRSDRLTLAARIRHQRTQLAWWNRMFSSHLSAMCRRRVYAPFAKWAPAIVRRAKARAALQERPHD